MKETRNEREWKEERGKTKQTNKQTRKRRNEERVTPYP